VLRHPIPRDAPSTVEDLQVEPAQAANMSDLPIAAIAEPANARCASIALAAAL
jgi:hypothetical protein